MPKSQQVTFDGLTDPVTVTFDKEAQTVTATAGGGSATVFVGELEAATPPDVVEAEPIVEPEPTPNAEEAL